MARLGCIYFCIAACVHAAVTPRLIHSPHPDEFFLVGHIHGKPHLAFSRTLDLLVSFDASFSPGAKLSLKGPVSLISWSEDAQRTNGSLATQSAGTREDVILRGLTMGKHIIHAALVRGQGEVVHHERCPINVAHAEAFRGTYAWQEVKPEHALPPGMEIKMDLTTHSKRARIPPKWTLLLRGSILARWRSGPAAKRASVVIEEGLTVANVAASIEEQTGRAALVGSDRLSSLDWSLEDLFDRQGEIQLAPDSSGKELEI